MDILQNGGGKRESDTLPRSYPGLQKTLFLSSLIRHIRRESDTVAVGHLLGNIAIPSAARSPTANRIVAFLLYRELPYLSFAFSVVKDVEVLAGTDLLQPKFSTNTAAASSASALSSRLMAPAAASSTLPLILPCRRCYSLPQQLPADLLHRYPLLLLARHWHLQRRRLLLVPPRSNDDFSIGRSTPFPTPLAAAHPLPSTTDLLLLLLSFSIAPQLLHTNVRPF
ncbi:hypothetical protein GW17_00037495 [Ensete ventricosum]|nr:hypothetical protein GW17_00037495 [Ensete ventricosum]